MAHVPDDLARRHLAKIVDSSDDAIVSKDLNGIILSWNVAAERMFGYTSAEAIGQSIRMIIPDVRQSEEDYVLGEIRAGKSIRHYETVRQRKDGTLIPISLTVSPIYDDSGVGRRRVEDRARYHRTRTAPRRRAGAGDHRQEADRNRRRRRRISRSGRRSCRK